ncbi:unnamed protein product, partial [Staurois parvus]
MYKKMTFFKIFKFPAAAGARTSDVTGTEHGSGCRHRPEEMAGDAAGDTSQGAKDKVSAGGTPYAAPHGKPECSSGLPLLVQK